MAGRARHRDRDGRRERPRPHADRRTCCSSRRSARDRILPIWIGPWEASAIAMRLQGMSPERPLTHDLFATALNDLGVRVDRVSIAALADETFHARLVLATADSRHEIDARPSDAIALAVRLGVPDLRVGRGAGPAAACRTTTTRRTDEGEEARTRRPSDAAAAARGDRRGPRPDQARHLPRVRQLASTRTTSAGRRVVELGPAAAGAGRRQSPRIGAAAAAARASAVRPQAQAQAPEVLTARQITDGFAPVGEPAVRG